MLIENPTTILRSTEDCIVRAFISIDGWLHFQQLKLDHTNGRWEAKDIGLSKSEWQAATKFLEDTTHANLR